MFGAVMMMKEKKENHGRSPTQLRKNQIKISSGQENRLPYVLDHVVQQKPGSACANGMYSGGVARSMDIGREHLTDEGSDGKRVAIIQRMRNNVVQRCGPDGYHIAIPGDADYSGTIPKGSWILVEDGEGAHLVELANIKGRNDLAIYGQLNTPRYYPSGGPENAGQAHKRLHAATRKEGIKVRGNPEMTDQELLDKYRKAYNSSDLSGIKGDLRTPDKSNVVARDVSPGVAFEKLLEWGGRIKN